MKHFTFMIQKRSRLLQALLFFVVLGALASCQKDYEPFDPVAQQEKDDKRIQEYLLKNNVDMNAVTKTNSGLYYLPLQTGNGNKVESGDKVEVKYKGWLLNGTEFDSNYDSTKPFIFMVGARQVIAGWDEGLKLMEETGKGRLYIPSRLGYGQRDAGTIPPNSVLVFDVEVVDIK
ncbi:FKBP-type peptidyl-prolyl cis-trans isomerase [Pontibacter sp. CAU 1760]